MQSDKSTQAIPTIPVAEAVQTQQSFNQAQLQAQVVQAQREQRNRNIRQQSYSNKLALSTNIFQGFLMLSASLLMLAIARYAVSL